LPPASVIVVVLAILLLPLLVLRETMTFRSKYRKGKSLGPNYDY
jgi:hypothetical protein